MQLLRAAEQGLLQSFLRTAIRRSSPKRSRLVTLESHKTLSRQGDETDSVYVVRNGMLRLYQRMLDGRRQVIGFAKAGDLPLFPQTERNDYSADALDLGLSLSFLVQDFHGLLLR